MLRGPELKTPKTATVNAALREAAASPNAGLVFVDLQENETTLSWREVELRAQKAAAALRKAGVKSGDRVALILPTSPEFIDAFFGTLLAGAVPVPLYPPVRLGRLEEYFAATTRMLRAADACVVVSDARISKLLGRVIEAARPPLGMIAAETLTRGEATLATEAAPQDLGLIQFSSGSTVDPKAVALTHANLMAQCEALRTRLVPDAHSSKPSGVCWLPLYHDMGLIGCVLSAVYYPGTLVLIPPENFLAKPALWLRAISRHKAMISPAPDFAYSLCARRIKDADLQGVDLSSWLAALNGAEPIAPASLQSFTTRFAPYGFNSDAMCPVYGLSEASLAVTASSPPYRVQNGLVSVGSPVPGCDLKIVDARGNESEGVGRIFVRGASVMRGYYGEHKATKKAIVEGWLDTGDLGVVRDGQLFVTGREKDIIIIRGQNHAPQEFESCLLDLDSVRTGCAVALPLVDSEGEGLLILAERAPGFDRGQDEVTVAAVNAAVLGKTGVKPRRVQLLAPGTLPRTSSGKLRRSEALKRFHNQALTAPNKVSLFPLLVEMGRSQLALAHARWQRFRDARHV